jgi:lycopene cyclase domain-containing protein
MSLYFILLLLSIAFPLLLSFDKKVAFYRIWKYFFPSAFLVGSLYIIADIIFVKHGIWGFNPAYHSGIIIAGLPLEEWLFFLVIPYACVFIHYVVAAWFPHLALSDVLVRTISAVIVLALLIITVKFRQRSYTFFNFSLLIVAVILANISNEKILNRYYITFLFMLVPFFIVNGILTGLFIRGEVVWYSNSQIIGTRFLTVPAEDTGYAFSLVLLNLLLIERLKKLY